MKHILSILLLFFCAMFMLSCHEQKEHMAAAINDRDSVAEMTSFGVNMLISDSGLIKIGRASCRERV